MIITDLTWLKKFVNIACFQIYKIISNLYVVDQLSMVTFKTVDSSFTEWLLDTPNLSLMSNKSIFYDQKSSLTVKESVVLTFWCGPGYIACQKMNEDAAYARNTESGCNGQYWNTHFLAKAHGKTTWHERTSQHTYKKYRLFGTLQN